MRAPLALGCLIVAGALAASSSASSAAAQQPAEAQRALQEARQRYADLDFDGAVEAFRRALAAPGLSEAERLEALEYLGCAYVVLERPDGARAAFERMLRIDPYRVLREATGSPRIRSFVRRLRQRMVSDAALDESVVVRVRAPRRLRGGQRSTVRAEVGGPRELASAALVSRSSGGEYRSRPMRGGGRHFEARLTAPEGPDELELYVIVRDSEGRVVARGGEPAAPVHVEIEPAPPPPLRPARSPDVLRQWWFWTAVAAAAASGVVIGIVVGTGQSAPSGSLPPGRVEIP